MILRSDTTVADALNTPSPGIYVTVKDVAGNLATIYSDDGVTPKANPFTSGLDGTFSYYAAEGAYTEEYRRTLGGQPTQVVAVELKVDNVIRTDLAAATGATLVGTTGPSTVQADLNARPTSAALAAATGATLVGSTGPSTVQADIDARPTSAALAATTGAALVGTSRGGTAESELTTALAIDIRALVGGDGDITATVAAIRAAGYTRATLKAGSYTCDHSTELGDLVIEGAGHGTIIAPNVADATTYLFTVTGSAAAIANLGADVSAGANSLTFASDMSAVLSPGDLIQIYNPANSSFSGFRTVYRAGEFAVVKSVSTVTVKLMEPLVAGYASAAVSVYKITPKKGGLKNLCLNLGAQRGLGITYGRDNVAGGLRSINSAAHGVFFDRCYNFSLSDCDIENYGDGTGSDYGVSVSNSQRGEIVDCHIYAKRHPVELGGSDVTGATPTRFVKVVRCRLANDYDTGVLCGDFHGNTEFCAYEDNEISGGCTYGGANNSIIGNRITNASSGVCVYGAEILGDDARIEDNRLVTYVDPSTGSRGVIDFSDTCFTENTTRTANLFIHRNRVKSSALSASTSVVRMKPSPASGAVTVNPHIEGVKLDVNALGFILYSDATGLGSVSSDRIIVDGVSGAPSGTYLHLANGSHFLTFPHRLQKQTASLDDVTPGTAGRSYVSAAQTYHLAYPRVPNGQAILAPQDTGSLSGALGGVAGTVTTVYFNKKTGTQALLAMAANNVWGTSQAFAIDWAVWLDEVQ